MRKTCKRLGALFLAVVMTLSLLPAAAFAAETDIDASVATYDYPLTNNMVSASSQKDPPGYVNDGYVYWAIDYNDAHWWHQQYETDENIWFQFSLPAEVAIAGIRYQKRTDGNTAYFGEYRIQTSTDGATWTDVDGETGTWGNDNNLHGHAFATPITAKFIRVAGGSVRNRTAKNFHLVLDETGRTTVTGTVTDNGIAVANAEVRISTNDQTAYKKATTNDNGSYSIVLPKDSREWTLSVAGTEGRMAVETITTNGAEMEKNLAMADINRTITGKVTTDGTTPLDGAKVELVQNNTAKSFVTSVTSATTNNEGTYSLDVSSVEAGQYCVRVSKDGHGAKLESVTVTAAAVTDTYTANVTLPAINQTTGTKQFIYDMTEAADKRPTLGFSETAPEGCKPTVDWTGDKMKLTFPQQDESKEPASGKTARMNRLVKLQSTNVKNGIIEFDATREGTGVGRFGLALRLADAGHWIFVGQWDNGSKWAREYWYDGNPDNGEYGKMTGANGDINLGALGVDGPSFLNGDTRHFKITIRDTALKLEIDGVTVFDATNFENGGHTAPAAAADVGFICGNNDGTGIPSNITIDNLYIFREDPTYTVTLDNTNSENVTLSAKIKSSGTGGDQELGGTSKNQASVGDVIVITGEPASGQDGKILGEVTVQTAGDDSTTVPTTLQEDGTFTFTMPNAAVTVTGVLKNAFTAELPQVGETGSTTDDVPKVDKAYTVTLEPEDATASYQWYHVDENGTETLLTTEATNNTATYTPVAADEGKTLKIVVTGTGNYAGIKTLTTDPVKAADVVITGFGTHRSNITMLLNGTQDDTNADETIIGGTTTDLVLTLNPELQDGLEYEPYTIEWSSNDTNVATVEAVADSEGSTDKSLTATLTAKSHGTAVITATLKRVGKDDISTRCTVLAKNKAESVKVKKGGTEIGTDPIVIYANEDAALDSAEGEASSVQLTGEISPAGTGIDIRSLNWFRPDGAEGKISIKRESNTGVCTISAADKTSGTNIGRITVWASVGAQGENDAVHKEFTVEVRRKLANDVSIASDGIVAEPKVGDKLSADTTALVVVGSPDSTDPDSGKGKLTYQWMRGDTNDISAAANIGSNDTGKDYTLTAADYGKYIFVVVTATPDAEQNFFYEGSKSAATAAVVGLKDGPAAPTGLGSTKCTTEQDDDGTITGLDNNTRYDVQKKNASDEWEEVTGKTVSEGKITGLKPGDYRVRIAADDANKVAAGAWSTTLIILAHDAIAKSITIAAGIEHGAVSTVRNKVEPGQTVTITVTPDTGYQLKSLTVTKDNASDGEANVTVNETDKTFTMPEDDVTITAEFEPIDLTIRHALTNLKCDLPAAGDDHTHTVKYGETSVTITLTADTGYVVPTSGAGIVTKTDGGALAGDYYTYTYAADRATATITFPNGIRDNLTITLAAEVKVYTVSYSLFNITSSVPNEDRKVNHGEEYRTPITASAGYSLPETITVKRGETELVVGTDYTYNKSTGEVVINASATTGALTIIANGVKNTIAITRATIDNVAMVGNQLSVIVEPTGATASYKWQVSDTEDGTFTDISGADGQTYTLTAAEASRYVRVVLTGTGDYSTPEDGLASNAVGPVAKKLPTGISLTGDGVVNGRKTAYKGDDPFTLTATVAPDEDGVDKTVIWSSSDTNVATVANGVVTIIDSGTTTITATDAAGHEATCVLTVERAHQYTVTYSSSTNYDMSAAVGNTAVTTGGTVYAGDTVTVSVRPSDGYTVTEVTVTRNGGGAVTVTKGADNTWTFTMPASDVTITATVVDSSNVPTVTSVTVDPKTASIAVGDTVTLSATVDVMPDTADNKTVTWTSSDDTKATVDQTGKVTGVAAGTVTITATSTKDIAKKDTCAVTVTAATQDAVKLTDLTVKNGTADVALTPAFAAATKTYTASVENSVESVTVTGTPETGATVTVKKGSDVCDNGVVALAEGENVVTVTVSQTGKTSTNYTITITRAAASQPAAVKLTSLTVKNGATDVTLTPAFAAATKTYTATVANSVESVTVTGTPDPADATVTVKKGDVECKNGEVALDEGLNAVTVTVTKDSETETYTITITRESGTVTPPTTYGITVDKPTGSNVTVTVDGKAAENAEAGKTVTVAVTGADDKVVTVAVSTADGTVDATKDANSNTWTFTMPAKAVTVNVTITSAAETPLTGTVAISGDAKYGATLTANVTGAPTGATLHYQWKSGDANVGTDANTYTLTAGDIGKTITVVVTADGYTNNLTAGITGTVAKADGPDAPTAIPVQCTGEGATGKITDVSSIHEYRKVTDPETETWTAVTGTEITGLEAGEYQIRVKETATTKAGEIQTVVVLAHNVETWNVTVAVENGTHNAPAKVAKNGALSFTLTASTGYELPETISVKMGGTAVADTGYTYDKTTGAVAIESVTGDVEITAACTEIVVDKAALETAITAAEDAKDGVVTGSNADEVEEGTKFVTEAEMKALDDAIAAAQALVDKTDATQEQVDAAVTALNEAVKTFNAAKKDGTHVKPSIPSGGGSSSSSSTTTVEKNDDGSTTTTVTDKKTGTVTETTEKPDGTKETVETKKDGTVTETVEKTDGSKEIKETKKDGTVTETSEKTDGSKEVVETKPDGTVTETKTDTEGAKTEKITDAEKNVAITVTDKEGEVLAKVELPAEIPAPETRFEDVPEGHWADEAIHNMAALEVVNGVGNDRFDMDSNMTRGALATVLSRLSNGQKGLEASFADVDSNEWYADGIAWAAKTGVVTGYSETNFGPEDNITREQLAVMLCRYARLLGMDTAADSTGLDKFNDGSDTHDWAADSIAWCVDNGILQGMGNGNLAPTATASRAQVAVMLQRFMNLMK